MFYDYKKYYLKYYLKNIYEFQNNNVIRFKNLF